MTSPFRRITPASIMQRVQVQQKPGAVRATLTMPNGRTLQCIVRCGSPAELGAELDRLELDDPELGFSFKKAFKKVGKGILAPVKLAHKYTHEVGPIASMHKKVQEGVAKALPITKPFIKVHNSLAAPVHKAIEGKKIKKQLTAKAIADVTKNLPPAQKGAAQAALVARVKVDEKLQEIAKGAARASVLKQAKAAAARGDAGAKKVVAQMKRGTTGTYEVRTPSGRVIKVPAAKVV